MDFFSEESLNESDSEFSESPPQTQTEKPQKPPPKVIAVIEANIVNHDAGKIDITDIIPIAPKL